MAAGPGHPGAALAPDSATADPEPPAPRAGVESGIAQVIGLALLHLAQRFDLYLNDARCTAVENDMGQDDDI